MIYLCDMILLVADIPWILYKDYTSDSGVLIYDTSSTYVGRLDTVDGYVIGKGTDNQKCYAAYKGKRYAHYDRNHKLWCQNNKEFIHMAINSKWIYH